MTSMVYPEKMTQEQKDIFKSEFGITIEEFMQALEDVKKGKTKKKSISQEKNDDQTNR